MRRLAFLLAIVGCADGGPDEDYPVEPSGTDTGVPIGTGGDTGGGGTGGGSADTLSGRICISNSLVNLSQCRTNDLAGFQVSLGGTTATTDESGAFSMPRPTGSLLSFTVRGPGAVTTTTPYSPSLTIPVIDADVYARALASHQIFAAEGTGAIIGTITRDGRPARDITVTSTPASMFSPFYDTEGGATFGTAATGARGVFWLPGIATGSAGLTFRDPAGGETTVAGVQVVNGGVTILDSVPFP